MLHKVKVGRVEDERVSYKPLFPTPPYEPYVQVSPHTALTVKFYRDLQKLSFICMHFDTVKK